MKQEKLLEIYAKQGTNGFKFVCAYPVLAASGVAGPKLREGDRQVPEGIYGIEWLNPNSSYHLSMRISYPNAFDRAQAAKENRTKLGGDIMIHGLPPERQALGATQWRFDWTNGCIALANEEIDEIWQRVTVGTPIEIRP